MTFEFVKRHDVRRTDDYWCELDEYRRGEDQFLLAHISVTRWSASVCKQLIREFRTFREHCTAPIFAVPEHFDEKWFKFVSLLGFRQHDNVPTNNGSVRPLFIHTI
jgi:hypothetical protein